MPSCGTAPQHFHELNLAKPLLSTLEHMGYHTPTPIQAQAIPVVLEGHDVLGQAQTGTGKTAAFGLPLLSKIDPKQDYPQVLILAPTRELVSQIGESLQKFAAGLGQIKIATIYGGQGYREQLHMLKRGAHIVVGAPGRVMDHIKRQTLDLSKLNCVVLDEADEMLRMGFVDDVEWICSHAPEHSQKCLFSATMPRQIKHIADRYLNNPTKIKIAGKTSLENITQRFWLIQGTHKLDALSRILETEETDGVIVFVRTKDATIELAERLSSRGFASDALNGDMTQDRREHAIERLKSGKLNILIATDVAARGLDVERISHVINYDIPFNPESYVHRIGRTGRAGRKGQAILFVSNRERSLLRNIERTTKQKIEPLTLPSAAQVVKQRIQRFKGKITKSLDDKNIAFFESIVTEYLNENEVPPSKVAAALVHLAQGQQPLVVEKDIHEPKHREHKPREHDRKQRSGTRSPRSNMKHEGRFETYRLEVGRRDNVKPGNILGAIANEADLERDCIGNISIFTDYSTVELPNDLPEAIMKIIANARVGNRPLRISQMRSGNKPSTKPRKSKKKEKTPAWQG